MIICNPFSAERRMRAGCQWQQFVWGWALIGALACATAHADTFVSGTINGAVTWTPSGSPYIISNAGIASTGRVTIEPGVSVQLPANTGLTVVGTLIAQGTAAQPIRFTAPAGPSFGGFIVFQGPSLVYPSTGLFVHCEFSNLTGSGGVLRGQFANFTLMDSTIQNIASTAIRLLDSRVRVINNTIRNTSETMNFVSCAGVIASNHINQVNFYADGIDIDLSWAGPGDSTILIDGNEIVGGTDPGADGIDFGTARNVLFRNNIVNSFNDKGYSIGENSVVTGYNNIAVGCTIGVAIKSGSDPDLSNFTIVNCVNGISAYNDFEASPKGRVVNSIVWGGTTPISVQAGATTTIRYCVTPGTTPWPGIGNITNYPSFVNAAAGDYHLNWNSPCINRGSNANWMATTADIDGRPRLQGGTVDIGAYEHLSPARFRWDAIASPQTVGQAFPASVTALDATNGVVSDFAEPLGITAWRQSSGPNDHVVITECGSYLIEIQAVGDSSANLAGWLLAGNGSPTNINDVHAQLLTPPANLSTGQLYASSGIPVGSWTPSRAWTNGAPGWVLLMDATGRVRDFVAWGWPTSAVSQLNTTVNGFPVSGASVFQGVVSITANISNSIQRIGNRDNNAASDFIWAAPRSRLITNTGLTLPFPPPAPEPLPALPLGPVVPSNGTWTGMVTVQAPAPQAILRATWGNLTSDSSPFTLSALPLLRVALPATVQENDGTWIASAMISVTNPLPAPLMVALQSSAPSRLSITDTVVMATGQTNVVVDLAILDNTDLDGDTLVTISANAEGYASGIGTMLVEDDDIGVLTLHLTGPLVEGVGLLANAVSVGLDKPPAHAVSVALNSSAPTILQVPPSVTLPAGATNVSFAIIIPNDSQITGPRVVSITAHVPTWIDGSDSVTVLDNESTNLTLQLPSQAVEGAVLLSNTGLVSISGTLTQNLEIALAATIPEALAIPPLVTITAGLTQVRFSIALPENATYHGARLVNISAAAPAFGAAEHSVSLFDNEAHHFGLAAIPSPQSNGVAFPITITAYDDTGTVQPHCAAFGQLIAQDSATGHAVTPDANGPFSNGLWSGWVAVDGVANGVWLTLTDSSGATASSAPFDIIHAPLHHFTWSAIASPQFVAEEFAVTISARDSRETLLDTYVSSAILSAWTVGSDGPGLLISEINHRTPDAVEFVNAVDHPVDISGWQVYIYQSTGWPEPLPLYTFPTNAVVAAGQVITLTEFGAAPGTLPEFLLGLNINWTETTRAAVLLRNAAGEIVDFACANGADAATIVTPQSLTTNAWASSAVAPPPAGTLVFERFGTGDTQTSNDWRHVAGSLGATPAELVLPFSHSLQSLALSPAQSPAFTAGSWNGNVRIFDAAPEILMRASDAARGVASDSAAFSLLPADTDDDSDLLMDAWERRNFGGFERTGAADFDGDGLSDAGEHEAGTSPTNARDLLRTTAVWVQQPTAAWYLEWPTISGRYYSVLTTTNLLDPAAWQTNPAFLKIPSTGVPLTFNESNVDDAPHYYKVRVQRSAN